MKNILKLIFVLTVICLISGLLLAWVNGITAEPIRKAAEKEKLDALKEVLPACDNSPNEDTHVVEIDGTAWNFYVARSGGTFAGAAFESSSMQGYGGEIKIMVGIDSNSKVSGIAILSQKETPGLGAKIDTPDFKGMFAGLDVASTKWSVKKDGGDIDHITAATISSRAVVDAVTSGLKIYKDNEQAIRAVGQ